MRSTADALCALVAAGTVDGAGPRRPLSEREGGPPRRAAAPRVRRRWLAGRLAAQEPLLGLRGDGGPLGQTRLVALDGERPAGAAPPSAAASSSCWPAEAVRRGARWRGGTARRRGCRSPTRGGTLLRRAWRPRRRDGDRPRAAAPARRRLLPRQLHRRASARWAEARRPPPAASPPSGSTPSCGRSRRRRSSRAPPPCAACGRLPGDELEMPAVPAEPRPGSRICRGAAAGRRPSAPGRCASPTFDAAICRIAGRCTRGRVETTSTPRGDPSLFTAAVEASRMKSVSEDLDRGEHDERRAARVRAGHPLPAGDPRPRGGAGGRPRHRLGEARRGLRRAAREIPAAADARHPARAATHASAASPRRSELHLRGTTAANGQRQRPRGTGAGGARPGAAARRPAPPSASSKHGNGSLEPAAFEAAIRAVFADVTRYPLEILEPQAALEEDLGIDSVKLGEVFAVLRERYELPATIGIPPEELKTIGSIAGALRRYLLDRRRRRSSREPRRAGRRCRRVAGRGDSRAVVRRAHPARSSRSPARSPWSPARAAAWARTSPATWPSSAPPSSSTPSTRASRGSRPPRRSRPPAARRSTSGARWPTSTTSTRSSARSRSASAPSTSSSAALPTACWRGSRTSPPSTGRRPSAPTSSASTRAPCERRG